jgi:hypothetical protein
MPVMTLLQHRWPGLRPPARPGEVPVTTYVQLALYPDPDEHFAYVRVVLDEIRDQPVGYKVICPAADCSLDNGRIFSEFEQAWHGALAHRREFLDEWLQPGIPRD